MDISPNEAEEALTSIDVMAHKTRHSIASSGAHTSLIITGAVWMVGFLAPSSCRGKSLLIFGLGHLLLVRPWVLS